MSVDNINTLAGVAIEVLERYAFMLGDPPETGGDLAALADPSWMITIAFTGPCAGGMGIMVPPALARQVAANLYGGEPAEVCDERSQDAVKELLNIVCGNYLHEVAGNGPVFDLAAPVLQSVAREEAVRSVNGKTRILLVVEGHPLLLFIEH